MPNKAEITTVNPSLLYLTYMYVIAPVMHTTYMRVKYEEGGSRDDRLQLQNGGVIP